MALALAAGLSVVAFGQVAAADELSAPTVVVEAVDDATVQVGAQFPPGWRLEAADEGEAKRQINFTLGDERCELATRRSEFADPTTDVDDFVVSLGPGSGFIFMDRQPVELPAGSAERIDIAANEGGRWSVYIVPGDGWMHELWCRADELPEDRWLPIAETLELGPEASLVASPFEAAVTLPETGVSLAFPEEWQVRGSSVRLGLLYAVGDAGVCSLSDYTSLAADEGWETIEDFHDSYVANVAGRADMTIEDSALLDLPAGQTGLVELSWADGTNAVRYSFADDDRWLALFCLGEPVPEDRWLSLAQSLEWLPQGDPA